MFPEFLRYSHIFIWIIWLGKYIAIYGSIGVWYTHHYIVHHCITYSETSKFQHFQDLFAESGKDDSKWKYRKVVNIVYILSYHSLYWIYPILWHEYCKSVPPSERMDTYVDNKIMLLAAYYMPFACRLLIPDIVWSPWIIHFHQRGTFLIRDSGFINWLTFMMYNVAPDRVS